MKDLGNAYVDESPHKDGTTRVCACVCPPGEFCLNKSCLRLVLSTVAKAGDEAFRRGAAELKE